MTVRRAPLSPEQYASYSMARVLILYAAWRVQNDEPMATERAMLLDFAAQHPRAIADVVPGLQRVLRAHHLERGDLSDLFAFRRFGVLREQFYAIVADLLARDLLQEVKSDTGPSVRFELTVLGGDTSRRFSSALGMGYRAVCDVICEAWARKNVEELSETVRRALPQQASLLADLSMGLPSWLGEEE